MPRCPVCDSGRVAVVLDENAHARCLECDSTWIQDGSMQRSIQRRIAGPESLAPPA